MTATLEAFDARLKRLARGDRLLRRNPFFYGSVAQTFQQLQHAPLSDRIAFTKERTSRVIAAARRTPYGKSVCAPQAIEHWPLLEKDQVREDPTRFHTPHQWFVARATTGGTTGVPLRLVRSLQSIAAEQASLDRMIASMGTDPRRMRMAVLRGDNIKPVSDTSPPYWRYTHGGQRLVFSTNHLTRETVAHFCQALEAFRADVLWVYPSALESLCRLLALSDRRVRVPRVLASSEMMPSNVWHFARERLSAEILDYYGLAERVAFAYARRETEYFFLPGYADVEFIPRQRDERWQTLEIVGTSLWNLAMPLVRYRTGDLIRVPVEYTQRELAEIAHGVRSFDGVIGRSDEALLAPDGESVLTGISHLPRGVAHLLRLQIEHRALDHVVLRVLADANFGDEQAAQLLANARSKIPMSVRIDVELAEVLQKTRAGKTPFIVRSPEIQALTTAKRT